MTEPQKTGKLVEKKITPRAEDFSQWYLDVIEAADLAEHGPVRGTMVIKPYGYALWERIQLILDSEFKKKGVQNAYFPMFIPESFLKREEQHVEGFAPEVAVVTHAGGKELAEPLIVRPTSETIIYDTISRWIHSHRDLPLLLNQWTNVVRWEMRPRLFLRTTEFLWQEGHTAHRTHEEADSFARGMLDVYNDFAKNTMGISGVPGQKTESEKFAGAHSTYTIEAMMQDGKALQFSTSHNLGANFAKVFNVSFQDDEGNTSFVSQTSWGLSTRSIGGLIMAHGDDKGLVLPPNLAPVQVVIVVIGSKEGSAEVEQKARELISLLESSGVRVHIDARELRPGEKFFEWEKKGVPLRIELGPKDVAQGSGVVVARDIGEKSTVTFDTLVKTVEGQLTRMQQELLKRSEQRRIENTLIVDTWDEFTKAIQDGKFVMAHWSGDAEVEAQIKVETGATIRCVPFESSGEPGVCIKSGAPSKQRVLFALAY